MKRQVKKVNTKSSEDIIEEEPKECFCGECICGESLLRCESNQILPPPVSYEESRYGLFLTKKEWKKYIKYNGTIKFIPTHIGTRVLCKNDKNKWIDITDYKSW